MALSYKMRRMNYWSARNSLTKDVCPMRRCTSTSARIYGQTFFFFCEENVCNKLKVTVSIKKED